MKKIAKYVIALLVILFLFYLGLQKFGPVPSEFKAKLDSLDRENDSLIVAIKADDSLINVLTIQDAELKENLAAAKGRVKVIHDVVYKEVEVAKKFDSAAIVKFYVDRYPTEAQIVDTIVGINKPILLVAATDLIKYDGAKKELSLKDSMLTMQDVRIAMKDSVITVFGLKEDKYKKIVINKDLAISEWSNQYNLLQIENKKLKLKAKFQRIASFAIIGGLTYMTLKK